MGIFGNMAFNPAQIAADSGRRGDNQKFCFRQACNRNIRLYPAPCVQHLGIDNLANRDSHIIGT